MISQPIANHRWESIQAKAQLLLSQSPIKYCGFDPSVLPERAGVYVITLKDETGEEQPLYIGETKDLRGDILFKRAAYLISNTNQTIYWPKGNFPRYLTNLEILYHYYQNSFLRFIEEPNTKDSLALAVALTLELSPTYSNN